MKLPILPAPRLALAALLFLAGVPAWGAPVISEFMAENATTLPDEEGDFPDWIEIFNPGPGEASLDGWHLTDDALAPQKWAFPAGVSLAEGARLIVFASGKDRGAAGGQLHANFQLDSAGEYLALVGPGGVVAAEFAPAFPPQAEDVAYGTGADVLAVVGEVAPVRVLVPADDSLADAWTGGAEPFDDSGWALGAGPAGYDIGSAAGGLGGAKASADFAFRYEFDVQPNTQDLDGNATPDFWNGWDIGVIAGGVATMESTATARDGTVATDFGGSIWREHFLGGDWTLEIRFRVASQAGTTGAVAILAATNADNQENFWLRLGASDLRVTLPGGALETIDTSDNTDAMHVVRIARSGGRHYVWRDGVLLNASLAEADGYAWAPNSVGAAGLRTGLGIAGRPFSSSLLGTVEIDYLRLDDGGAFGYEAAALYGGAIGLDVEAAMRGVSPTLYARFPFQVPEDPAGFDALTLRARYDDGIVAYLNGVRAFSANAPDPAPWDASSTLDRGDSEALAESEIDLTASLGLLAQGSNVLAIHGLNSAADADRFLIGATLELSRAEPRTGYLLEPTPGAENGGATERPADSVRFTPDDSVFAEAVSVTLETDEPGGEIYFTADGSDPATSGQLYTGPVALAESAVIRAHVRAPGLAPSRVESRRYAKLAADVQAFASPLPVVVLDNIGAGDVPGKVVKLNPLVSPPGNDGGGIQQVARQPLVMAIFDRGESGEASPANAADLTALIGMRERGSSSSSLSKKAYSVEAWDRRQKERAIRPFGMPAESDWVLYAPTEVFGSDRYDRSLLHNSFIYALSNQIGRYAARTQFVEVFLNEDGGEVTMADYRGLYVFMEGIKRDEDRVDFEKMSWDGALGGWMLKIDRMDSLPEDDPGAVPQHFHTPGPDGILTTVPNADRGIRPSGGQPDDHPEFYHSFFNFDSPQGYRINAAQRQAIEGYLFDFEAALYGADWLAAGGGYRDWIDVPSFIDHYLLSNLAKNQDAFVLSTWVYREAPGSLLKMGPIWDFDRAFATNPTSADPASNLMWAADRMWYPRLFADPEFTQAYIDRWQSLRRGALSVANMQALIDAQAAEITADVALRNGTANWPDKVQELRDWLEARAAAIDAQFTPMPRLSRRGGSIAAGSAVSAAAPAGAIYYTADGSDPREPGGAISPNAILLPGSGGGAESLVAEGTLWSYWDAGTDPGAGWQDAAFDDALWAQGNAELGFGDGDEATPIGGGPIDARHPAIYFRRDFTVADAGQVAILTLRLKRDDGAIVYLNGIEVARTNMGPGPATFETFASGNVSGEAENAWLTFEIDPAALAEGANTLAAEVHQDRPDSSDLSFDLSLSAVRADPAAVITIGESQTIRARALDGANWSGVLDTTFLVGAAPADASNLVISEFSYRPAPPSLDEEAAGFGNRTDFEFIELMNISGDAIDLGGVRFADGIGFAFAEGAQLAAGGRVVLASNAAAFAMRYGFAPGGAFTGQLDNDGEQIVLLDAAGGAIRDFVYNDVAPWPEAADGGGFALELAAPQANPDHGDPQNWRSSPAVGGSPGSAGAQALAGDPLADADGNGIADALDHAFAGDPRPIAATGIFDHEGGQAEFAVFALRLDAAADAAVRFQLSADLGTWEENAIYLGEFRIEGGVLERRYRAPMPRADSPQLFGRASVGD